MQSFGLVSGTMPASVAKSVSGTLRGCRKPPLQVQGGTSDTREREIVMNTLVEFLSSWG